MSLIASSPIALGGSDETGAADASFGLCAHPDHPAPGATFTRERDFDPDTTKGTFAPVVIGREGPAGFLSMAGVQLVSSPMIVRMQLGSGSASTMLPVRARWFARAGHQRLPHQRK
jgi:hypothetical protein